jgi:hypothetical protein
MKSSSTLAEAAETPYPCMGHVPPWWSSAAFLGPHVVFAHIKLQPFHRMQACCCYATVLEGV